MRIRRDQISLLAKANTGRHLAEEFNRAGARASFDASEGLVTVCDPGADSPSCLRLDGEGRVTQVVTPMGREFEFEFSVSSTKLSTPGGRRTLINLDPKRRVTSVEESGAGTTWCSYDGVGHLTKLKFSDGTSMGMRYRGDHRLTGFTDRLGRHTGFEHDEFGRLQTVSAPGSRRFRFEYGRWSLPLAAAFPDGTSERYEYASDGSLSAVHKNGREMLRCSFSKQKLNTVRFPDGVTANYIYGDGGQVTEAALGDIRVRREFNAAGLPTREEQFGGNVEYRYNAAGRLETLILPGGARIGYSYDADARITEITDPTGSAQKFNYAQDDLPEGRSLPSGLYEKYSYDRRGLLSKVRLGSKSDLVWERSFVRDSSGRVKGITDSRHAPEYHSYDAEGRLTEHGTSWDDADNRYYDRAVEYSPGERLVRDARRRFTFDTAGNRASAAEANGPECTYFWRGPNLLTECAAADGSVVAFAYDAFGRRVMKKTAAAVTTYVWAGSQMVCESIRRNGSTEVARRYYVFCPDSFRPLALVEGNEAFYFHNGNIDAPQLMTSAQGDIVWSARYEAWGTARIDVEKVENPLRFPGQHYDPETGLHYNRARYYDPVSGVYLSPDPAGLLGGMNPYAYANCDPVNSCDSLGLFGESWPGWAKTTVAIAGGIAAAAVVVVAAPFVLGAIGVGGVLATGLTIAASGMAAGATGYGLSAAMTKDGCIPCAIVKGLWVGALASLPFLAALVFPLVAGIAGGIWTLGGISGAISYTADWLSGNQPFSVWRFIGAVALGAATAGIGAKVLSSLAALRAPVVPKAPVVPEPTTPVEAPPAGAQTTVSDPIAEPVVPEPATAEGTGETEQTETFYQRVKDLSYNAEQDKVDIPQGQAAARYEQITGRQVEVGDTDGVDLVDPVDGPLSVKGPLGVSKSGNPVPIKQPMIDGLANSVAKDVKFNTATNKVVVDLTGLTKEQQQLVMDSVQRQVGGTDGKTIIYIR